MGAGIDVPPGAADATGAGAEGAAAGDACEGAGPVGGPAGRDAAGAGVAGGAEEAGAGGRFAVGALGVGRVSAIADELMAGVSGVVGRGAGLAVPEAADGLETDPVGAADSFMSCLIRSTMAGSRLARALTFTSSFHL